MPLFLRKTTIDYDLAVWKITEEESFFESHLRAPENIPHPKVRLQWYATRYLANELSGQPVEVLKDEFGKPYLKNALQHISLSHTVNYAVVILSKNYEVGIDIEAVHPRVERIAHKFLTSDELAAIKPEEYTAKLTLLWSAKEALYKLHGRKQLDFTTQLLIEPFTLQTKGELAACVVADGTRQNLKIYYQFFEGNVMAWVLGN
jgi:phosphopantetheinyl transferase